MKAFRLLLFLSCLILLAAQQPVSAQHLSKRTYRFGFTFGANVAGEELVPKYADYKIHPYGMFNVDYFVLDNFAFTTSLFAGLLSNSFDPALVEERFGDSAIVSYKTFYAGLTVGLTYALPTVWKLTPFIQGRFGAMFHDTQLLNLQQYKNNFQDFALTWGLGGAIEFPVGQNMSGRFAYDLVLTNTDYLDGIPTGQYNDAMSVFTFGFTWRFKLLPGKEDIVTSPRVELDEIEYRETNAGNVFAVNLREEAQEEQRQEELRIDRLIEQEEATNGFAAASSLTSAELLGLTAPANALGLKTRLTVTPFTSLEDLQASPSSMLLTISQNRDFELPLETSVEVSSGGQILFRGSAQIELDSRSQTFDAAEIMDFRKLRRLNNFDGVFRRGNYLVRVVTESERFNLATVCRNKFLNVDLRPIFGENTDDARDILKEEASDIVLEGDRDLVVNLFRPSKERELRPDQIAVMEPGEQRNPVRLRPTGMSEREEDEYLGDEVQHSFNEALRLQNLAKRERGGKNLKIIVSEVYFPLDEMKLTEEARSVLDNVARQLIQRPELYAEIRGYANDIGDATQNMLLAKRRADRVLEYLIRKKMDDYRMVSTGLGKESEGLRLSNDPRRGRRVEIILKSRDL